MRTDSETFTMSTLCVHFAAFCKEPTEKYILGSFQNLYIFFIYDLFNDILIFYIIIL
jgi:hypothetical protein